MQMSPWLKVKQRNDAASQATPPRPSPQFLTLPQLQLGDCPKSASFSTAISHIKRWVETFRFFV